MLRTRAEVEQKLFCPFGNGGSYCRMDTCAAWFWVVEETEHDPAKGCCKLMNDYNPQT